MADAPRRIQLRRTKGWCMPPNTIVVARPSRDGNPFPIAAGVDYHKQAGQPASGETPQATVVRWHREQIAEEAARDPQAFRLMCARLHGHNLACWCSLCPAHADGKPFGIHCTACAPCHADTLGELANA